MSFTTLRDAELQCCASSIILVHILLLLPSVVDTGQRGKVWMADVRDVSDV